MNSSDDTLKLLTNNPEIGIGTTLGSGIIHWLGVLNPVLSFISLSIAIAIGVLTLYGKIKNHFK